MRKLLFLFLAVASFNVHSQEVVQTPFEFYEYLKQVKEYPRFKSKPFEVPKELIKTNDIYTFETDYFFCKIIKDDFFDYVFKFHLTETKGKRQCYVFSFVGSDFICEDITLFSGGQMDYKLLEKNLWGFPREKFHKNFSNK